MGDSSQPFICVKSLAGPFPFALVAQGRKPRVNLIKRLVKIRSKRFRTRTSIERRARLEGSRRPRNVIQKRVKTLRKLVPNSESVGLDGLFREAADYIMSLQMRVKVMQVMVNALSGSDE